MSQTLHKSASKIRPESKESSKRSGFARTNRVSDSMVKNFQKLARQKSLILDEDSIIENVFQRVQLSTLINCHFRSQKHCIINLQTGMNLNH